MSLLEWLFMEHLRRFDEVGGAQDERYAYNVPGEYKSMLMEVHISLARRGFFFFYLREKTRKARHIILL